MQAHDSDDELRLGPLGFQGTDSENDTESKEHFRAQICPAI